MTMYVKDGRSFRQACKDSDVTFWQAYDKVRKYKMSPDDAINYCKSLEYPYVCYGKTLRQYCKEKNIPYNSVIKYHNEGAKESFEDIVDNKLYRKPIYSDLQFCKDFNINYNNAKSRHYYHMINKGYNKTFKDFCKEKILLQL